MKQYINYTNTYFIQEVTYLIRQTSMYVEQLFTKQIPNIDFLAKTFRTPRSMPCCSQSEKHH